MSASSQAHATSLSVSASFAGSLVAVKHLGASPPPRPRLAKAARRGRQPRAKREFRMGSGAGSDASVLHAPTPEFALVAHADGRFKLQFDEQWQGWVTDSERLWTLRELVATGRATRTSTSHIWQFPIPESCTIQVQLGLFEFWIRPTGPERPLQRRRSSFRSDPLLRCLLATAAVFLGAVFTLPSLTSEEQTLDQQAFVEAVRVAHSSSEALKEQMSQSSQRLRPAYASTAELPSPRERKLQNPRPDAAADPMRAQGDAPSPPTSSTEARHRARRSGLVPQVAAFDFAGFSASVKFDPSEESPERYGDLAPADLDAASGAWGHGIRKIGPGSNDGKDWGTTKAGPYAMSSEAQRRSADEYEAHALDRPHHASAPKVASGAQSIIDGAGLQYDVIRGQLGLRQRRLRRCFDEDSSDSSRPDRLTLAFHIAPDGGVGAAKAHGVADRAVQTCIEGILLSIRFPSPADGKPIRVDAFPFRI